MRISISLFIATFIIVSFSIFFIHNRKYDAMTLEDTVHRITFLGLVTKKGAWVFLILAILLFAFVLLLYYTLNRAMKD